MKNGRVYWITGLSGSGKTTIGTALYYYFRKKYDNILILDGDILKQFIGNDIGYTEEDRFRRGKKYSKLCKMLADQGMWVIICTIAMFDQIRTWNRKNIKGYIEIFLDVSMNVLIERDKKGLYSAYSKKENVEVVGVTNAVQFPKHPDIILNNDGQIPIEEFIKAIEKLQPLYEDDFDRDRLYWNEYYEKNSKAKLIPSSFALSIKRELLANNSLLDLGCGNGRDSLWFLEQDLFVTGIDASDTAIDGLNKITHENKKAVFLCDDFVKCRAVYQRQYDYIYSRFTLHAITEEQEDELLQNIVEALKKNGKLFIEARSIHDDLYGKGKKVAKNTYLYNGHFRRFINADELVTKLQLMGYSILMQMESKGLSQCEDSNPTLLRIIATN